MPDPVRSYYQDAANYDLVSRSETADLAFWSAVCQRYRPRSVLELAVGTGRIAIPLAQQGLTAGFGVWGIDFSKEMLERAGWKLAAERDTVRRNITLREGDIRNFELEMRFDLVFVAYNSLVHLIAPADRENAFRCAYRHTASGGRFMLDIFNPRSLLSVLAPDDPLEAGAAGESEDKLMRQRMLEALGMRYDPATQTMRTNQLLARYDRGVLRKSADIDIHIYFPDELRELLEQAGFIVEDAFGDYQWGSLAADSDRMIFVGRRSD